MNEAMPHILTDKEGKAFDIVDMTRTQAASLNDRLASEGSIYTWMFTPINDIEWTKAVHPGVGERLLGIKEENKRGNAKNAASRRQKDLERLATFAKAIGSPWTADRLERDPGGPGRAADRAGAIVDDLSREMCFFDFNFRAVLRDLPDEALETLEAIIARAKKERSPQG
jgi:hypothetical protein